MSRLSRANLKARDSVFNSGREVYLDDYKAICPLNLLECVAAMEDCGEEVPNYSPISLPIQRLTICRPVKRSCSCGMERTTTRV